MKLDDPKLTAFALNELNEPERSTMAQAVAESPEAQRFVAETREMARALEREFAVELQSERIALPSRNDAVPAIDHTKRPTGDPAPWSTFPRSRGSGRGRGHWR